MKQGKDDKISALLKYTNEHICYYKNLYKRNGIDVNKIDDFKKIPILQKVDVQEHWADMISNEYDLSELYAQKTSGSSGIPLKCLYDKEEKARRALTLWNNRKANCPEIFGKKMVSFHTGGRKITSEDISIENNVMYLNYIGKDGLNEKKLERFYEALVFFEPYFIRVLPSVLITFINYCTTANKKIPNESVQYIELVGEYLTEKNYIKISSNFENAKVRNFYGAQEFYTIGYSCSENNLHIDNDIYMEIVNPDSEGYGDIVITGLRNYCMPFIRYNLGDRGRIISTPCSCGSERQIIELQSSRQSEFFTSNGKKYSGDVFRIAIENFEKKLNAVYVHQFQIFQKQENKFVMYVVVDGSVSSIDKLKNFLVNELHKLFDLSIKLDVLEKTSLDVNSRSHKFKIYNFI